MRSLLYLHFCDATNQPQSPKSSRQNVVDVNADAIRANDLTAPTLFSWERLSRWLTILTNLTPNWGLH